MFSVGAPTLVGKCPDELLSRTEKSRMGAGGEGGQ